MPRKTAKANAPKAPPAVEKETSNRRGSRKAAAPKTPAKSAAEPKASEPKRSRRSSTAAQTAASQADNRKTRSRTNRSSSNSSERKSSADEGADRDSPTPRPSRRPKKEVNYEESDGDDENAVKPPQTEEDYEAEEEVENDSDSLESTSKKKGKLKPSPPQVKPRGRAKGRSKSTTASPRPSRSSRKKKDKESEQEEEEEEEDAKEEEEEEEEEKEAVEAPVAPSRRGRQAPAEKAKPKAGAKAKKAVAVATPSSRPGRAARQRKAPSSEEKEPAKPLRSSARSRKTKVEEAKEEEEDDEEMDEDDKDGNEGEEEKEGDADEKKEDTKKRKFDKVDQEEEVESKKAKVDEKVEEASPEEKEVSEDEPAESMEVDEVGDEKKDAKVDKETKKDAKVDKETKKEGKVEKEAKKDAKAEKEAKKDAKVDKETKKDIAKSQDEKESPVAEKQSKETKKEPEKEAATDKPVEVKSKEAEDEEEEEEEEEEEDDDEEEPEADKSLRKSKSEAPKEKDAVEAAGKSTADKPGTPVKEKESLKPVEQCSPSTNQKSTEVKQLPAKHTSDVPPEAKAIETSPKLTQAAPESTKSETKEPFQNSPTKSHDSSINGTPPQPEEAAKPVTHTSEPTQMLPSSALELNQQHASPTKPEVDRVRISANGHVTEGTETQNNCAVGLFHGRSYLHNRHPSAEVLSRFRERTFGLVSFNISAGKIEEKFLLDLKTLNSDIVCLQGITSEQFSQHLEPSLDALGYKGTFAQDSGKAVATFYRASVFHLKNQRSLPLKQTIEKDLESNLSSVEFPAVASRLPPCGQVLFTHLALTQSTRGLAVANVLVPSSDVSVQALQMSCLAREAIQFVESGGVGSGVPLVLCGAFNMQQKEAAYQLLRDGYLSNEMIETLQSKKDIVVPGREEDTSLVHLLWKSFQHSIASLKSCYLAVTGQEVEFPNQGSLSTSPDLIWFSSDSLTPLGVLEVSPTSAPTPGLHLPLKADLAFNY